MFRFVHKNLIQIVYRRGSIETHLCFSQNPCLKSISTAPEEKETPKASDFTVSYLVNTCGLSVDSALRVSKGFQLKTTENSDSVLSFFKKHGFTDTQIAKLISCRPKLLSFNPDKTIKPKMDFLRDAGFSTPDLTLVLSKNPNILTSSLDNQLVPN
ncbi:hypothetical protein QJS10_CPA16g01470 [Acorus calamus]|uniref:Uncharacterized protein n=1 Tax=Acorus calamus TaxID=4465 RepID=A0AAV9D2E9_ACOCL|nr:hypothetical protein QJS10_CPA16g01470 [Acorus calamus]